MSWSHLTGLGFARHNVEGISEDWELEVVTAGSGRSDGLGEAGRRDGACVEIIVHHRLGYCPGIITRGDILARLL
jgi:hypothetical protein